METNGTNKGKYTNFKKKKTQKPEKIKINKQNREQIKEKKTYSNEKKHT
jgi:hypothetical protein